MTTTYEVLDIRPSSSGERQSISAKTPEAAASSLLGMELVRSGSPRELTAKVYWQKASDTAKNVVRLYQKVGSDRQRRR